MELFAFAIMLIVTNAFFMIREIFIVINHNHEEDKTPYEVSEIYRTIKVSCLVINLSRT